MIIESANCSYPVIGYLGHDETKDIYLCERGEDRSRCSVIRIRDSQLLAKSVEFLYDQVAKESFSDLMECFVFQEHLHLVFRFHQGERLEEMIRSRLLSLEERLQIAKKILEKMVLQEMHCYFQSHCLRLENIYVTRSLDISFDYTIEELSRWSQFTMRDVQDRLIALIEFLFEEELKKEVLDPLKEYIAFLKKETYGTYLELYDQFQQVRQQVLGISKKEMEIPKTWSFRLWDRIKKRFPMIKRTITLTVLVLGLILLVWSIGKTLEPSGSVQVITQIGTERV